MVRRYRVALASAEVVLEHHDRRGDQGEPGSAADRGDVEQTAAHQWNICAAPGW